MSEWLFRGVCAVLGEETSDKRMIAEDADLVFDFSFPIPLFLGSYDQQDDGYGPQILGRVTDAKIEDGLVFFEGEFLGDEPIEDTRRALEEVKPAISLSLNADGFDVDRLQLNLMVTHKGKLMSVFLTRNPSWPDKVWIEVFQRDEER